jgi:hypothetical protein
MPGKLNEEKLREVQVFLQRVQGPCPDALPPNIKGAAIAGRKVRRPASYFARLIVIAASTLTVFFGDFGVRYRPIEPDSTQSKQNSASDARTSFSISVSSAGSPSYTLRELSPEATIGRAQLLMDSGQIVEARRLLLRAEVVATQHGAWRLARSYDPNYLASVASPDAIADKAQAAIWYRRWRDIGVRNGMEMDDLRLNRLINSMR